MMRHGDFNKLGSGGLVWRRFRCCGLQNVPHRVLPDRGLSDIGSVHLSNPGPPVEQMIFFRLTGGVLLLDDLYIVLLLE